MLSMFLIKKSADEFVKQKVSKTGFLDANRLHEYKLSNDIFMRKVEQPQGQNHGFVFLLDYSSSMRGSRIKKSLQQVASLAMFCRRAGIPFEAFLFLSMPNNASKRLSLLQLFDSRMSKKRVYRYGFCLPKL